MDLAKQSAKHFRDLHSGGNWTCSSLKEVLEDISFKEATTQIYSLNTIAILSYHINYYVERVLKVLEGGELNAKDDLSFRPPPILSEEDWKKMKEKILRDGEDFAALLEKMDDATFGDYFIEEKYGNYFRNIHGIIEHSHYHLGQISLIKKILREQNTNS